MEKKGRELAALAEGLDKIIVTEETLRNMFDGKETADKTLIDRFVNKRIPQNYAKKGMASPVLYHDKDTIFAEPLND